MSHDVAPRVTAQRTVLATQLGIPATAVTDAVLLKITDDPLFLHHLRTCADDPGMLSLLLREAERGARPPAASEPTAMELVGRAAQAIAKWGAAGFRRTDDEAYGQRVATCEACEHLTTPANHQKLYQIMGTSRSSAATCGLCGCDVHKKARMATEQCPAGRWPEP